MYKILRVIWDNSSRYSNVSDDLKQKMMMATRTSVGQLCTTSSNTLQFTEDNFLITHDLNDIIKKSYDADYTHVLVFALGTILEDTKLFIEGLKSHLEENVTIAGHILHHGLKDNNNFFTLHDQTILLSKEVVDSLEKDDFVFNNSLTYKTNQWTSIARTKENIHDDYTPIKIWKDDSIKELQYIEKTSKDGFGEDLIQYAVKKNWVIDNFNYKVRKAKKYSYYHEDSKNFEYYLGQPLQTIIDSVDLISETQYEFLYINKIPMLNNYILQYVSIKHNARVCSYTYNYVLL